MFCNNCGGQMERTDAFCPHCGALNKAANADIPAQPTYAQPIQPVQQTPPPVRPAPLPGTVAPASNTIAIVGFVLALIGWTLPALICSIMGLNKAKQGAPHKGLAVAGIVISVLVSCGYLFGGFLWGLLYGLIDAVNAVTLAPLLFIL